MADVDHLSSALHITRLEISFIVLTVSVGHIVYPVKPPAQLNVENSIKCLYVCVSGVEGTSDEG